MPPKLPIDKAILCKFSKDGPVKNEPPRKILRHKDCSPINGMTPKRLIVSGKSQISPISNFPPVREYDGGMPQDPTVVEIFALRRELAALRGDMAAAHKKITRAIETLHSVRRFLRLGLYEKQWDTYDELKRRLANLEGVLSFLDDPLGGIEGGDIQIPTRWKKEEEL